MIDKIQTGLIIVGTALGLAQIESILGIILLIVQVVLVLWKLIEKFKKSNSPEETLKALEEAQKEIELLKSQRKENDK